MKSSRRDKAPIIIIVSVILIITIMIVIYNTILNRDNVVAKRHEGGIVLRRWITNKRQVPEVLSIANEEEIREPDYKISNPLKLSDNTLVRCAFGNVC